MTRFFSLTALALSVLVTPFGPPRVLAQERPTIERLSLTRSERVLVALTNVNHLVQNDLTLTPGQLQGVSDAIQELKVRWASLIELTERSNPPRAQRITDRCLEITEGMKEVIRRSRRGETSNLVIVGQHFEADGKNFELAAQSFLRFQPPTSFSLTLRQTDRDELTSVLGVLPTDSISRLAYFGHGTTQGLIAGQKNLLLPATWSADLKIPERTWIAEARGNIYCSALQPCDDEATSLLHALLVSVLAPKASVEIRACNTGNGFGPVLNSALEVEECEVWCCTTGMNFVYYDSMFNRLSPGDRPVPDSAVKVEMIPGWALFAGWERMTARPPISDQTSALPNSDAHNTRGLDAPYRDILYRLYMGSADHAVFWDEGAQLVSFEPYEIARLARIFSYAMTKDGMDPSFGEKSFAEIYERSDADDQDLLKKIERLVRVSRSLYYKPLPPGTTLEMDRLIAPRQPK